MKEVLLLLPGVQKGINAQQVSGMLGADGTVTLKEGLVNDSEPECVRLQLRHFKLVLVNNGLPKGVR